MNSSRRKKQVAQVTNLPVAHRVGSPEHVRQVAAANRRQETKSLTGFFNSPENIYLGALCRFAGITTEVTLSLKKIDAQLQEAEKNRFLEPIYTVDILERLCEILSDVNTYAKDNLEISSAQVATLASKKTLEELSLKSTFEALVKKVKQVNRTLDEKLERTKGRSLLESIRNGLQFLARNLIFGTLCVALTTLVHPLRGLAYLMSCCSPHWKPDSYPRAVLKAWGNKSTLARWELQQTNKTFVHSFKFGMFKWVNGYTRENTKDKPRIKSASEKNRHIADKIKMVGEVRNNIKR
jgi:hypothetical protein